MRILSPRANLNTIKKKHFRLICENASFLLTTSLYYVIHKSIMRVIPSMRNIIIYSQKSFQRKPTNKKAANLPSTAEIFKTEVPLPTLTVAVTVIQYLNHITAVGSCSTFMTRPLFAHYRGLRFYKCQTSKRTHCVITLRASPIFPI